MPAGYTERARKGRLRSYGTLELVILIGSEVRSYYFATASLTFNGVTWQPQLRKTPAITSTITGEADGAIVEMQNVDTILGNEFAGLERYLYGAEAKVGRYWTDPDDGWQGYKVFLTGFVKAPSDNQLTAQLKVVSDVYAPVSVGPSRFIRGLCQAPEYKGFECGSTSDLPTCPRRLADCELRHPTNDHFIRHMGAPFLPGDVRVAIPE
jgi:hypothetical protein